MATRAESAFKKFINGTGLQVADSVPQIISRDDWQYFMFLYNNKVETFCYNTKRGLVDATLNSKYVTDGNYMDVDTLIDFYMAKLNLYKGEYADLLALTEMEFGESLRSGFNVIGWRRAMSYGNGFKYGDKFKAQARLLNFLNETFDRVMRFAKCWKYLDDPDVLLIHSPGFNFLITVEELANAVNRPVSEIAGMLR